MNIKRFHAATSREALAKARMAFGDGTLILSNRATANGVEVVATAEDTLHALDQDSAPSARPALQPMQTSEEPRRPAPTPSTRSEPTPSPAPARRSVEAAQAQLKKLAAQAHGETVTQLLSAWQQRQPDQLPSAQELGRGVTGGTRSAWAQALQSAPQGSAAEPLLRLEMAAEVPTPAEHLDARRALQLQLLTRRNDPAPAETWAQDAGKVLATAHDDATARRLQNALKVLMRK